MRKSFRSGISYLAAVMKLVLLNAILISCATVKKSGSLPEDEFFITRKYVGNFIDYSSSVPDYAGGPHSVLIKTSQDTIYGRISAYSRKCSFQPGERLYIRRVFQSPGVFGNWKYQIENDNQKKTSYFIKEFKFGDKILVQSWY